MMFNFNDILIVAAHPDDEILGCGGTIARFAEQGARISALILGEGPAARGDLHDNHKKVDWLSAMSALKAASIEGIGHIEISGLPDNRFDVLPLLDIVKIVEETKNVVNPDLVFTHQPGDINIDHQITSRAVITAFRPLPSEKNTMILGFEVPSSTEFSVPGISLPFHPIIYIDISASLPKKLKALEFYSSEIKDWPHPRSYKGVEYLNRLRGCQCGKEAAEAFMLYRGVI